MPGLLDFLNPSGGLGAQGGFTNRIEQFNAQNPGALVALGAGIMNRNPAAGFAAAAPIAAQGQRNNATAQFLLTKGIAKTPEEAMAIAGQPELLRLAIKAPDEYTQRADAAVRYGLKEGTPEFQNYVLGMGGQGSQETWGVTPIWGKNAAGDDVLGVNSDRGNFKPLDTGADFKPMGTGDKAYDRSYQGGLGKNRAEADANYRGVTSQMPGLEKVVAELKDLADKATYTGAGQLLDSGMSQLGMEPREAAIARTSFEAKVNNQVLPLLRRTFGAQFTEREGETLRATMGDINLSPKQKQAALNAFIDQKRRDIDAMAAEAGLTGGAGGSTVPAPGGNTRLRFNPATGELE